MCIHKKELKTIVSKWDGDIIIVCLTDTGKSEVYHSNLDSIEQLGLLEAGKMRIHLDAISKPEKSL